MNRTTHSPAAGASPAAHDRTPSWHVVVLADDAFDTDALVRAVGEPGRIPTVLVVAPALNSRLRTMVSDEGAARQRAQERLDRGMAALAEAGVTVTGEIGDGDPVLALEDALRTVDADRVVVVAEPDARANWRSRDLAARARRRIRRPVLHIVTGIRRPLGAAA